MTTFGEKATALRNIVADACAESKSGVSVRGENFITSPAMKNLLDALEQSDALYVLDVLLNDSLYVLLHEEALPYTQRDWPSDAQADAANIAWHEFVFGTEEPLTARDLGITRQAWKTALQAAGLHAGQAKEDN